MAGVLPAVFMRGGTSNALMLCRADVPGDLGAWAVAMGIARDAAETARAGGAALRVVMPSGILTAHAAVARADGGWRATRGSFFRTARPLMRGEVFHDAPPPG